MVRMRTQLKDDETFELTSYRLWLIEAIGFEGNRPRGVELMTKSAESKSLFCTHT